MINQTNPFELQNPDIVLVHYLNVPYPDDNKLATVAPSLALWADKKEWTKDELVSQLKPMCEYFNFITFIAITEEKVEASMDEDD